MGPRPRAATVALLGLVLACQTNCAAAPTASTAAWGAPWDNVYTYVRQAAGAGGSTVQDLRDCLELDDGQVLVVGETDSLGWLPGIPAHQIALGSGGGGGGIDNSASSAARIGFVLSLRRDFGLTPTAVSYFSPGAVDGVHRIRTNSAPGESTGALFLSGPLVSAQGSAYFICKLDRNFVRGAPTALLWSKTVLAAGGLDLRQPWDVAMDGDVTLVATAASGQWSELQMLEADGRATVVQHWREHYHDGSSTIHHAVPATAAAERSVVVLDSGSGRCGLRSWSSADFSQYASDLNGGGHVGISSRRGAYPWDVMFGEPCNSASPSIGNSVGYTGLRWDASSAVVASAVVVDRRDGSVYVGLHAAATPTTAVPAVIGWSATGQLRWWSRLMPETSDASAPELAVTDLSIDYSGAAGQLVVLAGSRGDTTVARQFWAHPLGTGFQQRLGGSSAALRSAWLGKLQLSDGMLTASTFIAELATRVGSSGHVGLVGLPEPLAGFADMNQLPAADAVLADTACRDVRVDAAGMVSVSCEAQHTATTSDAHHRMWAVAGLGNGTQGTASRNHFARVYAAGLGGVVYSSLVTGEFASSGSGGDNVLLYAALPVAHGLVVVAAHEPGASKLANPIPVTRVSWGGSQPQAAGPSGIVGRFSVSSLVGWPVSSPDTCAKGSETYLPNASAVVYACSICQAGKYADVTNAAECTSCPRARYSAIVGANSLSSCAGCPVGHTSHVLAAVDSSQCIPCSPGNFASAVTSFMCHACVAGTYAMSHASSTCIACPVNTFSTVINSSTANNCIDCPVGQHGQGSGGAGSQSAGCTPCAPGTYGAATGMAKCTDCAAGKASASTRATAASTCAACALGTVAGSPAMASCVGCTVGRFSSNRVVCTDCPPGTASGAVRAQSSATCQHCAPGKYSAAGASTCSACAGGSTSQPSSGTCFTCTSGDNTPLPSISVDRSHIKFGSFAPSPNAAASEPDIGSHWIVSGGSGWGSSARVDDSVGVTALGALKLTRGTTVTQTFALSHVSRSPLVFGGTYTPVATASGSLSSALDGTGRMTVTAHLSSGGATVLSTAVFRPPSPAPPSATALFAWAILGRGGGAASGAEGAIVCAAVDARHEVRCCSDVAKSGYTKKSGCSVWGESQFSGAGCVSNANFAVANQTCAADGARLCTKQELQDSCTEGSGCGHDGSIVWSGGPCTPVLTASQHPLPINWHAAHVGADSAPGTESQVVTPLGATSISVELSATETGWFDDVYLSIDPRVACWCSDGYAYNAVIGMCVRCSAGSYCRNGLQHPCAAGFVSSGGATACYICPTGFTCVNGEAQTCVGMTYMDGNGNCQPCPSGSACVNARRDICPPGQWSDGTLSKCALCIPGRFSGSVGSSGCQDCLPGYYSTVGNPSCTLCPVGETSHPAGPCFSCSSGRQSPHGTTECGVCPNGTFNNQGPVARCQACPNATSNANFTSCV